MTLRNRCRAPWRPYEGGGRNSRKVPVLAALARSGWLRPRELHTKAGFPLAASPWSYLRRLQKWGLVRPRHVDGGAGMAYHSPGVGPVAMAF